MSLFNGRKAVNGLSERIKSSGEQSNPVLAALADLRAENERLRRMVGAVEGRVTSLEGFRDDQETFNAGTQQRVSKLQRHSAGADLLCPGCGQPSGVGTHGVSCFRTIGDS